MSIKKLSFYRKISAIMIINFSYYEKLVSAIKNSNFGAIISLNPLQVRFYIWVLWTKGNYMNNKFFLQNRRFWDFNNVQNKMIISFVSVMYKIRSIKHGIFFFKKKDILFMCVEYMIINKRVIYRCIFFLFNGDEKKGEESKWQACLLIFPFTLCD